MTTVSAKTGAGAATAPTLTSHVVTAPQHQQHQQFQIRHSGRAMIRGKIRRIWRPRYLELWDNAVVRYYELPPSLAAAEEAALAAKAAAAETAENVHPTNPYHEYTEYEDDEDQDLLQLHKIPKYTLRVFAARILDVTTLRDMHVGLPQGSFGFVFRGQRLMHNLEDEDEYDDELFERTATMMMMMGSEDEVEADYHTSSFVESPRGGGIAAGDTTSAASASLSSLLLHNLQCGGGAPDVEQQRDFLCAVPTLEEAQMWVIALQWAAQQEQVVPRPVISTATTPMTRTTSSSSTIRRPPTTTTSESLSSNTNWWRWQVVEPDECTPAGTATTGSAAAAGSTTTTTPCSDHQGVVTGSSVRKHPPLPKRPSVGGAATTTRATTTGGSTGTTAVIRPARSRAASEPSLTAAKVVTSADADVVVSKETMETTTAIKLQQPQLPHQQPQSQAPPKQGKVVVARVVDYRLIRCCRRRRDSSTNDYGNNKKSTTTSSNHSNSSTFLARFFGWTDSWHLDIAYEIHALLIQNNVVEQLVLLRTAHDLSQLLQEALSTTTTSSSSSSSRPIVSPRLIRLCQQLPQNNSENLAKSLSIVDSILRSLVMDATVVNTPAMKDFLGLNNNNSSLSSSSSSSTTSASWPLSSPPTQASIIPLLQLLWHVRDSRTIQSRTVTELTTSAEDYVRQWLQERNHHRPNSSATTTATTATTALHTTSSSTWDDWAVRVYQRYYCSSSSKRGTTTSWTTTAVVGLSVVAVLPFAAVKLWQYLLPPTPTPLLFIPRLSLRLDTLVGSWMTAAYLGCLYEQQQKQKQQAAARAAKKNTAKISSSSASRSRSRRTTVGAVTPAPSTPNKENQASVAAAVVEPESAVDPAESLLIVGEEEEEEGESDGEDLSAEEDYLAEMQKQQQQQKLSSPLPEYPANQGMSCWSQPRADIFHVRGASYLQDRVKIPSGPGALTCRGVDIWITDNPERHISRHPSVLGGKLGDEDTFLVNFLLPFGNFVAYFSIPPLEQFPSKQLAAVWTSFLKGDQQYRDARLKLLPVVMDGPWIVKTAVGGGKTPALLGKVIPLQYFFRHPSNQSNETSSSNRRNKKKGVYEVDVIITASTIAKGILSVVKGHTKSVSIAFAFIIEASEQEELPETVLCSFQVHSLYLEDCPLLPKCNLDQVEEEEDPTEQS